MVMKDRFVTGCLMPGLLLALVATPAFAGQATDPNIDFV